MSERTIKAGTTIIFGAPANPMPEIMRDGIAQVVGQVPGVIEAHLPQCFIEGDTDARQVLVISVRSRKEVPHVAEELMGKLKLLFAPGQFIDIIPYVGAPPESVREARCQIFVSSTLEQKPWWRFW